MQLDIVHIFTKTLVTFGVMKYLRSYLSEGTPTEETAVRMPFWDIILKYAWVGTLILMVFSYLVSWRFIDDYYYYLLCFAALYIIYQARDNRSARLLIVATLPFLILGFLNDILSYISPEFYKSYGIFFNAAKNFAVFWLIGFGIYAQKQNKREKLQRLKEEEDKRLHEAQKKELEHQVAERTAEITSQKEVLEKTLDKLKATQAQLIQSEKLASLGELTAGIAHEIQNPLNFVNNFAELSVDLAHDLKQEISKIDIPEKDKDYITEILSDLTQNQDKINHHGKRASNIVKGMLEHSRASPGRKEMTDINALADEYLRLSYHGLRAKDKNFNADFKTTFAENLPKIEVIPQDMGRVLLNLFNNAFYAVNERNKQQLSIPKTIPTVSGCAIGMESSHYTPSVSVSTKRLSSPLGAGGNGIEIRVKDNGTGMPESVKAKIFQPFFTTKPTGEGTGLGLSLAYDIVTKGHGGTLEVVTTVQGDSFGEGGGTEFIISLAS